MPVTIQNSLPVRNSWVSPATNATATLPGEPDDKYQPGDPYGFSPLFPAWYGPSGPTGMDTGDGVAVAGQRVINQTELAGDTVGLGTTTLICTAFENSKSTIDFNSTYTYPAAAPMQNIASNTTAPNYDMNAYRDFQSGGATWISATFMDWGGVNFLQSYPSTNRSTMPERYGEFRTQYGVGAEADHSCTGAITWYDAPGATGPGTNPLPASLFGSVNKVRTFVRTTPRPPRSSSAPISASA